VTVGGLEEGFEGSQFPPAGWTLQSNDAPDSIDWHRETDPVYVATGGAAAAVLHILHGLIPDARDVSLISPLVYVSASDTTLKFKWTGNPYFDWPDGTTTCGVRIKGDTTWTSVWDLQHEDDGTAWQYLDRVVSLAAWQGDTVQIRFHIDDQDGPDFAIDDIATGVFPLTAPPENDLCAAALPFDMGPFTISGSTCYATNDRNPFVDSEASCVSEDALGLECPHSSDHRL
jgi:hypothetical protein